MRIEGAPLWAIPRCRCGHHMDAHHPTPKGRYTWCSVFSPEKCRCERYEAQTDAVDSD